MFRIFFLFGLLLSIHAGAQEPDRNAQINKLRKIIDREFALEHAELKSWKSGQTSEKPPVPAKLRKIYLHLSRLYKLKNNPQGERYYLILASPAKKPVKHSPYASFSVQRLTSKIEIDYNGSKSTDPYSFWGFGGSFTHFISPDFTMSYDAGFFRGDIKEGPVAQEDAVLFLVGVKPQYWFFREDNFSLGAGVPVTYTSLRTGTAANTDITEEKVLDFGLGLESRFFLSKQMNLGLFYHHQLSHQLMGVSLGINL